MAEIRTYKLQIEYSCLKLKDISVLNASKRRENYLLNNYKKGVIFFITLKRLKYITVLMRDFTFCISYSSS